MNPQERALFEALGKVLGVKYTPEEWAKIAWPTAFVVKRTGMPKAEQSVKNAQTKAKGLLELFAGKKIVEWEWTAHEGKIGQRKVYWRAK